jgi:hypothetical protein
MIKDTIEFRVRRSDDEREPRKWVWNNRLTADHDIKPPWFTPRNGRSGDCHS